MTKIVLLSLLLAAGLAASATEASAVVCAKGVHRAGCAGSNGAIVGRRTISGRKASVHGHYSGARATVHRRLVIRHY